MIRFDSVTKRYRGAPRAALDDVSLEIGSGEFVFLVGASGSGKSSLLRLMLREERPTTGEIHVLGQRLTSISSRKVPYFRRSLGVVFQDFRLLPNKTVFDNVAFTLQVIGKSRGFIQSAVPDVLGMVGLSEKAQNLPTELSGGEQQRVAIARAVVNKPAILLADEPTGNLDPPHERRDHVSVLDRINDAGTTVVMATHDVDDRRPDAEARHRAGRRPHHPRRGGGDLRHLSIPIRAPGGAERRRRGDTGSLPVWARRGRDRKEPPVTTGPTVAPGAPPQTAWQQPPLAVAPAAAAPRDRPPADRRAADRAELPRRDARRARAARPCGAGSDTGPVLAATGDSAPWRRARARRRRATPRRRASSSPRPAAAPSRGRSDRRPTPASTPTSGPRSGARRRAAHVQEPTPAERTDPRIGVRAGTGPIDLDDTGDPEGLARRAGRHRDRRCRTISTSSPGWACASSARATTRSGALLMRLGLVLGEAGNGLRRNLSMVVSIVLVTFVSLTFVGAAALLQLQIGQMKNFWYDKAQVAVYLCNGAVPSANCGDGERHARADRGGQDGAATAPTLTPFINKSYFENHQQAYKNFQEQFKGNPVADYVTPDLLNEAFWVNLKDPIAVARSSARPSAASPGVDAVTDQRRLPRPDLRGAEHRLASRPSASPRSCWSPRRC